MTMPGTVEELAPGEEHHLKVVCERLESLDSALAWVVQRADTRFRGASMVEIHVHQMLLLSDDGVEGTPIWGAMISGIIAEGKVGK